MVVAPDVARVEAIAAHISQLNIFVTPDVVLPSTGWSENPRVFLRGRNQQACPSAYLGSTSLDEYWRLRVYTAFSTPVDASAATFEKHFTYMKKVCTFLQKHSFALNKPDVDIRDKRVHWSIEACCDEEVDTTIKRIGSIHDSAYHSLLLHPTCND